MPQIQGKGPENSLCYNISEKGKNLGWNATCIFKGFNATLPFRKKLGNIVFSKKPIP